MRGSNVAENDVASALPINLVSELAKSCHELPRAAGQKSAAACSQGNFYNLFVDRWRDGFAVCLETLEIRRDRLPDVSESLGSGRTLRYATRQGWNLGDKDAILVHVDPYSKLHGTIYTTTSITD